MGHTPMDAMPTWLSSGGVDVLERLALVFSVFLVLFVSLWGMHRSSTL